MTGEVERRFGFQFLQLFFCCNQPHTVSANSSGKLPVQLLTMLQRFLQIVIERIQPASDIVEFLLRGLLDQPAPSERGAAAMLDGLGVITDLVAERVGRPARRVRAVAAQR